MAYSINPNLVKARAFAMQLLIRDQLPMVVVARKCGVHRSTVWRWKQKWLDLNKNVQLTNNNRPNRSSAKLSTDSSVTTSEFRFAACTWQINTIASRPNTSPNAVSQQIVARILELRAQLKRCAEVIWHYLVNRDGIKVSLSSVRRILRRHHCFDGARKKRVRPDNPRRPLLTGPGQLVQTDTIHYVCPYTYRKRYVYTVIDLYTRMAYAEIHHNIRPGIAASVIEHASTALGFKFNLVQADNGLEFSRYFEQILRKNKTTVRHSRLGRPNDNAHIERFNRTIQEECLGSKLTSSISNKQIQIRLTAYLDYYNQERVHLGLQLRTPAEVLQRS
jgi:transposase InsO family protein